MRVNGVSNFVEVSYLNSTCCEGHFVSLYYSSSATFDRTVLLMLQLHVNYSILKDISIQYFRIFVHISFFVYCTFVFVQRYFEIL